MKHEKLSDALGQISDRHIAGAVKPKRRFPWVAAVAAVLALAILLGTVLRPQVPEDVTLQHPTDPLPTAPNVSAPLPMQVELLSNKYAVATAQYPQLCAYPQAGYDQTTYNQWRDNQKAIHDQPEGYADSLQDCWAHLLPQLLTGKPGENTACSPVNIYMALAMLAECTGGQSRQQLLDLMNADTMEALRTQANQVWRAHYNDDGLSKSILGSSLWLEENYGFNQDTVKLLADNYYASVFQGDLGSQDMNKALQSWLNEQTEGLLSDQVQDVNLDPETVLALATTVNYQVQWINDFSAKGNIQGVFHGTNGDISTTFMRQELTYGPYYWSDNFGAVGLGLEDGSTMWLFLPDEGIAPESIAAEALSFLRLQDQDRANSKSLRIKLSVPKFDVASDSELSDTLKVLGVTDIFTAGTADFSAILPEDDGGCIDQVKHAARVLIDEKGVTAAAFTVIDRCGSAMPPEDVMDFTLDRPFLFIIESRDDLPLFAGIVNQM